MHCFCNNPMDKIKIGKNEYYLCPSCGYLRKLNILPLEGQKERYDHHVCDEAYLKYMDGIYNRLKGYLRPGLSLDYGCGKLHALSDILNKSSHKSDYYDLFYYKDEDINKKYDNIILIEVFEHILDIYELMSNFRSMLNDGGRVIIMTEVKPKELKGWWYLRDTTHVSFVDIKTMDRLAKMLEYDIIYDEINNLFIFTKK